MMNKKMKLYFALGIACGIMFVAMAVTFPSMGFGLYQIEALCWIPVILGCLCLHLYSVEEIKQQEHRE